jgi:hypothetical protein
MDVSTTDSFYDAMNLADLARQYINVNGEQDPLFIAYFGIVSDLTPQLELFNVCPGLP